MANPLDILLRVKGDSSGAVQSLKEIETQAEKTDKVVQGRFEKWGATIASAATKAAASFSALQIGGQLLDQLTGGGTSGRVQQATSGPDLAAKFSQDIQSRTVGFQETGGAAGFLRNIVTNAYRQFVARPAQALGTGVRYDPMDFAREREAREEFGDIARSDPARAKALLAQNLGRYEPLRGQFEQLLKSSAAVTAYNDQLKGQTNINVYTGVGDPNAVGRQVRAALDARDRNNGAATSTFTRR